MKHCLLVVLLSLGSIYMFGGTFPPEPADTCRLINDRIRNTIAVDPDVNGQEIRFYTTTFGLENYDGSDNANIYAPVPKIASLVRFGIANTDDIFLPWTFSSIEFYSFDDPEFTDPSFAPVNCYNDDDERLLSITYSEPLMCTDMVSRLEGEIRYLSGTGSWASPVLYKDQQGNKHVLILNKSGCLISMRISASRLTMDWSLDLRQPERMNDPDSHRFEFMATPVIVDGKIYIAGIKMIHIVDMNFAIPPLTSLQCLGGFSDDHFEMPMVYDTLPELDRSLYVVSRLGSIFQVKGSAITPVSPYPLGETLSPPILDTDGHVYFVSDGVNGTELHSLEQVNRLIGNQDPVLSSHILSTTLSQVESIRTPILTDFTQNMYLFSDNWIYRFKEPYSIDLGNLQNDPVTYPISSIADWRFSQGLGESRTRFPGNNAMLSYHNSTQQTMLLSLVNENSLGFSSEVSEYYPSCPDEYNLSQSSITLQYIGANNSFQSPNFVVSELSTVPSSQSWGGIAPYESSIPGYLNALVGDECGNIVSYKKCLSSGSVGYSAIIEPGEEVIPAMGYSKFMQNQNNILSDEFIDSFKVYLYGQDYSSNTLLYANGYARNTAPDLIPGTNITTASAEFNHMIPNQRYRIAWINSSLEEEICENVEISENNGFVVINSTPDLLVSDTNPTPDAPDHITSWVCSSPLHFDTVTVDDNAHWRIFSNSNVSVTRLVLGSGSKLTIGDGAMISVQETIVESSANQAQIDVVGNHTGILRVTSNLEISTGCSLKIKGYNLDQPSYTLSTLVIKADATLVTQSMNELETSDQVSLSIGSLLNSGTLVVNDCVEITSRFIDSANYIRGELVIKDNDSAAFGNLIWSIYSGKINSTFTIGHANIESEDRAKLTIIDSICNFSGYDGGGAYHVHGTLTIKGKSQCIVNQGAELFFLTGSRLSLEGDLDSSESGAELLVNKVCEISAGVVRFDTGVHISGRKPNPLCQGLHGDRVITDEYGRIEGVDDNPRKLVDLKISSSHPQHLRWDGIFINTSYPNYVGFSMFSDTSHSIVEGIDRIDVTDPGAHPSFEGISFDNCTYGVYSKSSEVLQANRVTTINNCTFKDCRYGIYVEDLSPNDSQGRLSSSISDCDFGAEDGQTGFNFCGISLLGAKDVVVEGCNFGCNGYGLSCVESSVLVGGEYGDYGPISTSPCYFHNNDIAGVYFSHSDDARGRSLLYGNHFIGTMSNQSSPSNIGIWADDTQLDIIGNQLSGLMGHGVLLDTYSWNTRSVFHGFANNVVLNNIGCEMIGDGASLSMAKVGHNQFEDVAFSQTTPIPQDPLTDMSYWDRYILANLSSGYQKEMANLRENSINPNPYLNQSRFYPSFRVFRFDVDTSSSIDCLLETGIDQFLEGFVDESITTMKHIVEAYPDSTQTKLAIDFLYKATRLTASDLAELRSYLDDKISSDNPATYTKKEDVITKSYIADRDYITAINRLQQVVSNPETIVDSLLALIDQAYCYMNMGLIDDKTQVNSVIKTQPLSSYLEFIASLAPLMVSNQQSTALESQALEINSNYPNPFNPSTTICFRVPSNDNADISIFNIRGQLVRKINCGPIIAGVHRVTWDGRDETGRAVGSGIYFARIQQGGRSQVHKMMLVK